MTTATSASSSVEDYDWANCAENVFARALETYRHEPVTAEIIQAKSNLRRFLAQEFEFDSRDGTTVTVTDFGEEADDDIMARFGLYRTKGLVAVVVSGGVKTPQERIDHLIRIFPCFEGATFEVPFKTPNGIIHFIPDGATVPYTVKRFINCGPCSTTTLNSIRFDDSPIVVTVGANSDGTSSAGINQKKTDTGVLEPNPGWNEFIARAKASGAIVKNMDVNLTRYVPFPNPRNGGHPDMMTPQLINSLEKTTAMFIISRPPIIAVTERVNESNSVIGLQLFSAFDKTDKKYQLGLIKLQEYIEMAKSRGLPATYYEKAAIPIMITYCMGGQYKEGVWGFSPADRDAREMLSCLTLESSLKVLDYIRTLEYFTPAYDPLAYIEAFL
jgi:hypothetical protein